VGALDDDRLVEIAQGLEVRPQHDAVSDPTLTVLAAVASPRRSSSSGRVMA
jgi:hypothetical protein